MNRKRKALPAPAGGVIPETVHAQHNKEKEMIINKIFRHTTAVLTAFILSLFLMPAAVFAAPADDATVQHSGTSGTVTWELYTDGTLVIRPTEGDEGTMNSLSDGIVHSSPWTTYRTLIKKVETKGTIHLGSNANYMFYGTQNCTEMDLSGFDTSNVTSMASMFYECKSLTSLNLSGFDTGNVINMNTTFYNCSALTSLDLSSLNTENVTNMRSMFQNCSALTSIDLSGLNTGNATNMRSMFSGCSALTSLDLSDFDTGKVTTMDSMFTGCKSLTSLDLSDFDTGNVTNMDSMFHSCSALTSLDLSGLDTGKVVNMGSMFNRCSALTSLDLSNLDTGNVANMSSMFYGCKSLTSLDLSGFDTGNVTNMDSMFSGCSALTSLDLSGYNAGKVTTMRYMFGGCESLTSIDLSGLDTGNVINMGSMFYGCSALTSLDLSGFDTGNVTDMSSMFNRCNSLSSLDISGFDTSSVRDMGGMFCDCYVLSSIDLSCFNTSKATNMSYMFSDCRAMKTIDVSTFDTSKVTNMQCMFRNCQKLTSLDVSNFNTSKTTNMKDMFNGCRKMEYLNLSSFNTLKTANMANMFEKCSSLSSIDLGEDFRFNGTGMTQCYLPTPPSETTTGKWIREDQSVKSKTPAELRDQYDANAAAWAGKWVWEEKPVNFTVKFNPPAEGGYSGSMPDQKIKAAEAGTLDICAFKRFDYSFDHWEGSDGKTYTDGQTIPANTFKVGDTLTLTAVFTKDKHVLNFTDGEAEFSLKAGEKAVFSGIPGGSSYQVWEETPSGWQLVKQVDPSGTIPANGTADAKFYNEYVPGTTTITLMAQKTIDGHVPDDGAFKFELLDADGQVIGTASNNASGIVQFETLTFTDPGTFVYSIREKRGDDAGINYDAHTEVITITVEDDGQGNLTAVSSSMTALPSFSNETKPGMLQITKRAQGGSGNEVFTFEIELTNEAGMPLDNVNIVGGQ